ncbi:FAD-binding oxidoreductase [Pelagibacterium xiamenense]|uniref:FAD-binding oxidoreductase n=1 Tax=Pelagibacterium xiamenense TaxID=2901140 RepID=UPI001E5A529E|nr:FAD-binding oxidoreductase [Pelagibacterium xiamenense]MCD7058691.1 FAD-binding oxidoreductase [Pelagibacterium xiamenense]
MTYKITINSVEPVTHNVRRFRLEKPEGFHFEPGQATDVAIDKDGWRENKHPFTFTSLNDWSELEFTTKIYPERNGVTDQLGKLQPGDHLLIEEPWGTIQYKGAGTFIAGGAGVTPFIAILRQLEKDGTLEGNTLLFSNRTEDDIILKNEFELMGGLRTIHTLTDEDKPGYEHGRIDRAMIEKHVRDFSQHFYVCGPDAMVDDIKAILADLGAKTESVVFEA